MTDELSYSQGLADKASKLRRRPKNGRDHDLFCVFLYFATPFQSFKPLVLPDVKLRYRKVKMSDFNSQSDTGWLCLL